MKKLINAPKDVVSDMLRGLVALYPSVSLLSEHGVLFRSDIESVRNAQVAVISGGGSGHEPAHGGFVGAGMLSAAVAGEVFTSPPPDSVLAAIQQVAGPPGALLIVKNYTGDRLNFGLAAEMARSRGIPLETVGVADDIALSGTEAYGGARGLAGTVLVHKIAGAMAAAGESLQNVALGARSAAADLATIGLSLSAGTVPAIGKPSYALAEDEVELGLGIHGEPGVRRMAVQPADAFAEQMVEAIVSAAHLGRRERIAVLVNNLGATTAMELAIFGGHAVRALQSLGMNVERVYSGAFVTSLETAGVSLSILRVDDERLALLDAPTRAPAWPNVIQKPVGSVGERIVVARKAVPASHRKPPVNSVLASAIQFACEAVIAAEERLTELDQACGDGDLGINLAHGARAIQAAAAEYPLHDIAGTFDALASDLQKNLGGTSGPLYAVMFLRAAQSLGGAGESTPNLWARVARDACDAVAELGGATAGDRTMLDALLPFAATFQTAIQQGTGTAEAFERAVGAAEAGAESTASMFPRRGRASYLGARVLGISDSGAVAVAIWLRAIQGAIG